jgi:uncharacterized NAD(P)/FAD-binding protein YdhS
VPPLEAIGNPAAVDAAANSSRPSALLGWFGAMRRISRRGGKSPETRIGIVGGGFSGTAVLVNLVELAAPDTIVELFEARSEAGEGVAYGTRESAHLLNVQAGRIGALASQPDHFFRWLLADASLTHRARLWPGREVQATDYVPRALYAAYLKDLLARALEKASQRGIDVRIAHACVDDASLRGRSPRIVLRCREEGARRRSYFDALVLATGNFPPRHPPYVDEQTKRSKRYVNNIWELSTAGPYPFGVGQLSDDKCVVILGTGLTAVDAVLTLQSHGFKGKMIALSRNGRLPAAHSTKERKEWKWRTEPDLIEPTARALLHWLKQEARQAIAEGIDWRNVFDALRPHNQRLWQKLSTAERRKVLRKHSLWSIHRHRMAPEIHEKIAALQREGKLEILAARVSSIGRRYGGLRVRLRRKGVAKDEVIRPALVLNCTGPEYDVAAIDDRLLQNLLRKDLIVGSPVGAGIAIGRDGTASHIFAIGPLLVGELFECTAVPELRELARDVAERVCRAASNK